MVNKLIGTFGKKVETYNLPQQHKVITSCLPMIRALSIKIARKTGYSREDLFQESVLGLIRAMEYYECKNGAKFSTYAYFWAMSFISKYIENEERNTGLIYHDNSGKAYDSPEKILLEKEMRDMIARSLRNLKPMQRKIICLRFFADQNQNKSLNDLAAELRIKKTSVRRIYKNALLNLRSQYDEYG